MIEKQIILAGLAPLFDKAEREGLMFHCSYQDLWFTPAELQAAQAEGRFIWGAVNWTLRHPDEREAQLKHAVDGAVYALQRFRSKR